MFCCTLLYVHSSIVIILVGKRELVALLNLPTWCLMMVERLFLAVPLGCLRFVIVVFPDHTNLLFLALRPIYGQLYGISILISSMSSEGSDKSAHMYRLTRAFTDYIHKEYKGSDQNYFVDHFCYFCFVFVMLSCLFIAALWSPAGKG